MVPVAESLLIGGLELEKSVINAWCSESTFWLSGGFIFKNKLGEIMLGEEERAEVAVADALD